VEEAAAILGIGRSAAYQAVASGELPALRIGRRIVVPAAALDRLLRGGEARGVGPSMNEAGILERVGEYRDAARQIVEADAEVSRRCLGLLDLVDAARAEDDPITRRWSEGAIWSAAEGFLLAAPNAGAVVESWEAAQRRLRARGYVQCPECRGHIATDGELEQLVSSMSAKREKRRAAVSAGDR
jgi:excisionase family DNA binding protein